MKLTGEPHPLDRMVTVQPNTIAVLFEQDSAPRLKFPGEYLTPGLLPSLRPVRVLAVNTSPVELDVTVDHLVTMDGHDIERCTVRVTVQLSDRDRYALRSRPGRRVRDRTRGLLAAAGRDRRGDGDARRGQDESARRPAPLKRCNKSLPNSGCPEPSPTAPWYVVISMFVRSRGPKTVLFPSPFRRPSLRGSCLHRRRCERCRRRLRP